MTDVWISCPKCGMTSHNPHDVQNDYCGNCHSYIGFTHGVRDPESMTCRCGALLTQCLDATAPPPPVHTDQPEIVLAVWVIYERPLDFRQGFVVRSQAVLPMGMLILAEGRRVHTLEQARALIPQHLVRMDRDPNDDPTIAEVWL